MVKNMVLNKDELYMQNILPSFIFMFVGTEKPVSSVFFMLNIHMVTQFVILTSIGTAIVPTLVAL
jgi:hypothetical protein